MEEPAATCKDFFKFSFVTLIYIYTLLVVWIFPPDHLGGAKQNDDMKDIDRYCITSCFSILFFLSNNLGIENRRDRKSVV